MPIAYTATPALCAAATASSTFARLDVSLPSVRTIRTRPCSGSPASCPRGVDKRPAFHRARVVDEQPDALRATEVLGLEADHQLAVLPHARCGRGGPRGHDAGAPRRELGRVDAGQPDGRSRRDGRD